MRRWILLLGGLLLLGWFSPVRGTDVGELQPVELVQLYREGAEIVLSTDTSDMGAGATLREAVRNLKATTAGTVFLETADYVLITPEMEELVGELGEYLRPGIEICIISCITDPKEAARYLSAHHPGVTLRSVRYGKGIPPHLSVTEGRFELEK